MGVEEERKYEVGASFRVPELTACLPPGGRVELRGPVTLTATYYDTEDLRLARTGASLRFRRGDRRPWTVKLPSGAPGLRHEISRDGDPATPPAALVALVTAVTRGAPLRPVVVLQSRRQRIELRDGDGGLLAEIADDAVSVLSGPDGPPTGAGFREVEVERIGGDAALLDRVGTQLVGAGAVTGAFTPKHVRALGDAANRPPDPPRPEPLARKPRAGDVVTAAIRRSVQRILAHDPLARLRETLPGGDTPVHQLRVGCRRLRSDLRTFRPLVDAGWAGGLREELRWLGGSLGAARDAEVLRARLRRVAHTDPLAPLDPSAVERIDAELAARQHEALAAVDTALASERYRSLLDRLVEAAAAPRLTALACASAKEVLPDLVSRPWDRLARGRGRASGAARLAVDAPDGVWHAVRVDGKRARYAVEAVAEAVGDPAPELGRRLAEVQDVLGEHQDAAIAAQTWLSIAASDPDDHLLAVTAGRLYERERARVREIRAAFPAVWRAADRRRLREWLG